VKGDIGHSSFFQELSSRTLHWGLSGVDEASRKRPMLGEGWSKSLDE
jgi:hypothetical protein